MTYGDANRLLATIRQERPELFSGTISRSAITPNLNTGGWLVHIGPAYQEVIYGPQEWQAFKQKYPTPESVPAALRRL